MNAYKKEEDRLTMGWTHEPATFYENNNATRTFWKLVLQTTRSHVPECKWTPPQKR